MKIYKKKMYILFDDDNDYDELKKIFHSSYINTIWQM